MTKLLSCLASPRSGTVLAATAVALMSLHAQASTGRDARTHVSDAFSGTTAASFSPGTYHYYPPLS